MSDEMLRGEEAVLRDYLDHFRTTFEQKCEELDAEQLARRSVPPSTLSLLGLVRHLAAVEFSWWRRVMGHDLGLAKMWGKDEHRDADFDGAVADDAVVAEAWAAWRTEVAHAREFQASHPLDHLGHHDDGLIEMREVVVHLIEEYARHCGHADLLRECIDGRDRPVVGRSDRLGLTPVTDKPTTAWGFGLATIDASGAVLDVWFPEPALGEKPADAVPPTELTALQGTDTDRGVTRDVLLVEVIDLQSPPKSTEDVWLRLHLLSSRRVTPHSVSLDGIFGLLTNVVWTSAGPCAVDGFELTRARLRANGRHLAVYGVDKFPRMVDYVLPAGVRIADADRVRLGAHLATGTTVMHEGFVNYNAGTLGSSMVEGRISAGVVVGDGSDVGGGASIMGTLSGGGKETISIGERCLLGANAGVGISLGDDCVVEAGCYVTAGTKVTISDMDGKPKLVKALELSGASNVLFRRNSVTGAIEAVPWKSGGIQLNAALHSN